MRKLIVIVEGMMKKINAMPAKYRTLMFIYILITNLLTMWIFNGYWWMPLLVVYFTYMNYVFFVEMKCWEDLDKDDK